MLLSGEGHAEEAGQLGWGMVQYFSDLSGHRVETLSAWSDDERLRARQMGAAHESRAR